MTLFLDEIIGPFSTISGDSRYTQDHQYTAIFEILSHSPLKSFCEAKPYLGKLQSELQFNRAIGLSIEESKPCRQESHYLISIITQSSQRDECFAVGKSPKSTKNRNPILQSDQADKIRYTWWHLVVD